MHPLWPANETLAGELYNILHLFKFTSPAVYYYFIVITLYKQTQSGIMINLEQGIDDWLVQRIHPTVSIYGHTNYALL